MESIESLSEEILECVRYHHERWEGGGYPGGIAKEEIPLGGRIIAVADTIDAMRTTRPYRGPVPMEGVREEIMACKGTQFDPDVVEAARAAGLLGDAVEEDVAAEANKSQHNRPRGGVTAEK